MEPRNQQALLAMTSEAEATEAAAILALEAEATEARAIEATEAEIAKAFQAESHRSQKAAESQDTEAEATREKGFRMASHH